MTDSLTFLSLGIERYADRDSGIVVHFCLESVRVRLFSLFLGLQSSASAQVVSYLSRNAVGTETHHIPIGLLLHDQSTPTGRHQSLKHLFKVFTDLLERPLDSFIFTLIKRLNELFDTFRRCVEVISTVQERLSFGREIGVLLKRFLVDVRESFEGFVDLV